MEHAYNKKKQITDTHTNMDKSPENYTEWKKKSQSQRLHTVQFHYKNGDQTSVYQELRICGQWRGRA